MIPDDTRTTAPQPEHRGVLRRCAGVLPDGSRCPAWIDPAHRARGICTSCFRQVTAERRAAA